MSKEVGSQLYVSVSDWDMTRELYIVFVVVCQSVSEQTKIEPVSPALAMTSLLLQIFPIPPICAPVGGEPTHAADVVSRQSSCLRFPAPESVPMPRLSTGGAPLLPITRPCRIGRFLGFFSLLWGIPVPAQMFPSVDLRLNGARTYL